MEAKMEKIDVNVVKFEVKVEADKCKGCKACMKLGCPAISMNDGKAVIDHTQCVGCGICQEQCKFAAIN